MPGHAQNHQDPGVFNGNLPYQCADWWLLSYLDQEGLSNVCGWIFGADESSVGPDPCQMILFRLWMGKSTIMADRGGDLPDEWRTLLVAYVKAAWAM